MALQINSTVMVLLIEMVLEEVNIHILVVL